MGPAVGFDEAHRGETIDLRPVRVDHHEDVVDHHGILPAPSLPEASRPASHTVRCFSFEAPLFASMAAWAAASRAIGTRKGEQLT